MTSVLFSELLERDVVANNSMYLRAITVFVPTNKAFQNYGGSNVEVLYHMSTTPYEKDQLPKPPTPVVSDMGGNPPLHITRNREGDIFVNNARLIQGRSVVMHNDIGKKQVMHVLEDVLEPLVTLQTAKTEVTNPDAFLFLQNADFMNIDNHRLRTYRSQVTLMKKENLFYSPGGHTFLMPVDDGFKSTSRSGLVDAKVIDGHVIPNNVLFTSAVPLDSRYTSEAYADNLKVTISFFMQENKMYVKSITTVGDAKHPVGVVMAEIVKSNIPVRNGVVHLIQRPLMIVDTTVDQFLKKEDPAEELMEFLILYDEDNENGALYKFHQAIMETGGDILDDITKSGEVTILAPSNEAWTRSNLTDFSKNKEKIRDLLKLHVMKGRIDVEQIRNKNAMINLEESQLGAAQWSTISNKTYLYFNIKEDPENTVVTVEGGGVNATLEQPDVAQTNGFVHIIDRVLGVPYKTILMKLEEDPMLRSTYNLGQYSKFNEKLNNTFAVYTYFVATNKAWDNVNLKYPSTHKKLFMRDFMYHSQRILERHLLLADHAFTIEELYNLSSGINKVLLPTLRDSLSLKIEKENEQSLTEGANEEKNWPEYFFYWRNIKIKIIRPDIECTNGIIHVIDIPILEPDDVRNTIGD
ncbi:fasciclin-1-like [Condylostylus longicornis]|uniref:fasciclin-1-like n=1 Tax=Condylostylus longicornis TaxID=2530218 RepID=UPI00244E13B7|nr:fasciclin-1-like [Condylostylus longicornis]